jgi:hypothetical protein
MSWPGIEPGPPQLKASKKPFEQFVNSYSEHLHMSVRQRRMLVTVRKLSLSGSVCVSADYTGG